MLAVKAQTFILEIFRLLVNHAHPDKQKNGDGELKNNQSLSQSRRAEALSAKTRTFDQE